MMDTKTVTLAAALLLGLGCSHATPKPQSPTTAMTTPRRAAPPPYRQVASDETSTPRARDDAGEAIYFDFDSANLRQDAGTTLQQVGRELKHSQKSVRIEGNCDERGTTEYNIALGDKRAWAAKHYLERLGIPDRRISIVSYGSERPKNPGHDETAWAQNRRDDFRIR
jgi:peptidoglycan-associated lipoprotein